MYHFQPGNRFFVEPLSFLPAFSSTDTGPSRKLIRKGLSHVLGFDTYIGKACCPTVCGTVSPIWKRRVCTNRRSDRWRCCCLVLPKTILHGGGHHRRRRYPQQQWKNVGMSRVHPIINVPNEPQSCRSTYQPERPVFHCVEFWCRDGPVVKPWNGWRLIVHIGFDNDRLLLALPPHSRRSNIPSGTKPFLPPWCGGWWNNWPLTGPFHLLLYVHWHDDSNNHCRYPCHRMGVEKRHC